MYVYILCCMEHVHIIYTVYIHVHVPYSAKFSRHIIFAFFADWSGTTKIRCRKIF